jgi:small nuclear ribonucleoprotein (snRNP)-like protein
LIDYSRRTSIVLLLALLGLSACTKERQHVTVTLKNGETYSGTLEARDASTITILTAAGEAKTFLTGQIQAVDEQKKTPESAGKTTPNAPASAPAAGSAQTDASAPGSSGAPALGRITIPAGTVLALRLNEVIDGADKASNFGRLVTTSVVDSIKVGDSSIPADSPLNITVLNKPGTRGREMTCTLSGVFLGNRAYVPEGGSRFGGKDPALGTLSAPPKKNLPPAARNLPLRLSVHSVIQFKLTTPITIILTDGGKEADLRPEQTARVAPAASQPGLLEKFQAPASGALSIQAGQIISLVPNQPIDTATMFPHAMLSGEITADIPGSPIAIPSGAVANLEILQFPPNDASKTVFGLTGINIKGHLYKVGGTASARLGTTFSAGEPTPRLATGAVLSWKLVDPLVLREVK